MDVLLNFGYVFVKLKPELAKQGGATCLADNSSSWNWNRTETGENTKPTNTPISSMTNVRGLIIAALLLLLQWLQGRGESRGAKDVLRGPPEHQMLWGENQMYIAML